MHSLYKFTFDIWLCTDRQTDRRTDKQKDTSDEICFRDMYCNLWQGDPVYVPIRRSDQQRVKTESSESPSESEDATGQG